MKILKALNSEQSPSQLASAVSLAAIIGLTPLFSLHNAFVLLVVFWFRVNLSLFIVMWPIFSLFGLLLAPQAEALGLSLLQAPSLVPFWESFYNTLLGRWSNFYYGGVLGSLVIALCMAIVLFPISKVLITQYREKWLEKFEQFKVIRLLKTSKLWMIYQNHSS